MAKTMNPLLAQAGINLAGSAITGTANRLNNDRAYKRDSDMWNYRFKRQNSYKEQAGRMKAAGLNPALMYGGQGGGGASAPSGAPEQKTSEVKLENPSVLTGGEAANLSAVNDKINQDIALSEKNAILVQAQTASELAKGRQLGVNATISEQLMASSLDAKRADNTSRVIAAEAARTNQDINAATKETQIKYTQTQLTKLNKDISALESTISLNKLKGDQAYSQAVGQKISNIYESFKADAGMRGSPIDEGVFGAVNGILNKMSTAISTGSTKPSGVSPALWKDYKDYINKKK